MCAGKEPDEPGSREKLVISMNKYPRSSILRALLSFFLWSAAVTTSQADTGTLRLVFGKAGAVAAVGSGEGVLTFHGKRYPFIIAGASVGATLGVSASVLRGTATNISTPNDLAGTYTGTGVGAAVAAGVSAVKLRNDKGVVLELRGAKFGVEASANLPLVSITMK
jgi:ABC-type enterobactin transport system permease subunit